MKKIIVLSAFILTVILTSCSTTQEPAPAPESPVSEETKTDIAEPQAPEQNDQESVGSSINTSEWQSYSFVLDKREVTLKLPDGVYTHLVGSECELYSTPETVPPGFLVDSRFAEIKVGQIYFADSYQKVDDFTYQKNYTSDDYGTSDGMESVTYTFSDEIKKDVFSRYNGFIVFITKGGDWLDTVDYYNDDLNLVISFWFPESDDIYVQISKPMFEAIADTVQVI